jgi:hypothetical protein
LEKVVSNSRFLIVGSVKVANLASHVLGETLRRLVSDWEERYGEELALAETFVDGDRFEGVCYRASNWQRVGKTAGRAKAFPNGKIPTGKKDGRMRERFCATNRRTGCSGGEDRQAAEIGSSRS